MNENYGRIVPLKCFVQPLVLNVGIAQVKSTKLNSFSGAVKVVAFWKENSTNHHEINIPLLKLILIWRAIAGGVSKVSKGLLMSSWSSSSYTDFL